jgi:hypothetical protein
MLDIATRLSLHYCERRFKPYGSFASLPVYVTVISIHPDQRPFFFRDATQSYQWTDICKAEMEKSIRNLGFDDHDFFTIDDYQLFLPMYDTIRRRSDEQIEQDMQELLDEVAKPRHMLKGHAESMLRAVEFWKLRYETTYPVWMDRFNRVMTVHSRDPDEVDEGYSSD